MQKTFVFKLILSLLMCSLALPSWAVPKFLRTTLPFPRDLPAHEGYIAAELIQLQVYQDHKDPNQYYFIPPFHIRQYAHGAGGYMPHVHNVRQYGEVKKEIDDRLQYIENYTQSKFAELRRDVELARERVNQALLKLEEAIERGNARIIELREDMLTT